MGKAIVAQRNPIRVWVSLLLEGGRCSVRVARRRMLPSRQWWRRHVLRPHPDLSLNLIVVSGLMLRMGGGR